MKILYFFLFFLLLLPLLAQAKEICDSKNICYNIIDNPQISGTLFDSKSNYIYTTLEITNKGIIDTGSFIVELRPEAGSCNSFSTVALSTNTCDAANPSNVYAQVDNILPGKTTKIFLKTPPLPSGKYCSILTSVDSCCVRRVLPGADLQTLDCNAVSPFGWSTKLGEVTVPGTKTAVCGDGVCIGGEHPGNCAADCGTTGYYGDGFCSAQENPRQEPACALIENAIEANPADIYDSICNKNNVCEPIAGESNNNCPFDCLVSNSGNSIYGSLSIILIILSVLAIGGIIFVSRKLR